VLGEDTVVCAENWGLRVEMESLQPKAEKRFEKLPKFLPLESYGKRANLQDAYRLVEARYVLFVEFDTDESQEITYIGARVKPKMKSTKYAAFLELSSNGNFNKALCSCPVGKSGYCCHVFAVLEILHQVQEKKVAKKWTTVEYHPELITGSIAEYIKARKQRRKQYRLSHPYWRDEVRHKGVTRRYDSAPLHISPIPLSTYDATKYVGERTLKYQSRYATTKKKPAPSPLSPTPITIPFSLQSQQQLQPQPQQSPQPQQQVKRAELILQSAQRQLGKQ